MDNPQELDPPLISQLQRTGENPLRLRQAVQLAGRLGLISPDRQARVLTGLDQGSLTPLPGAVALAAGIETERLNTLLSLDPRGAEKVNAAAVAQTGTVAADSAGRTELMPGKIARYELIREIARGGMGVVYEALDPGLDRSVAIKTLLGRQGDRSDLVARLRREARLAGSVAHPGIINVHEVGEHLDQDGAEPITYVVMDYVPGPTLGQAFEALSFDARIGILRQACQAMAEAHRQGVIHRDLKPSNILLPGEQAIITDFGLARTGEVSTMITQAGAVLGTPAYMAPEQVLGQDEAIGATVDVWALGVMLYQMSTCVLPFRGASFTAVFASILDGQLELPRKLEPGLSLDFEAICLKALARRPTQRYPDAAALSADLERWNRGLPVEAQRATRLYLLRRWASRSRAAVAAAAGILLALIVAFLGIGYQLRIARLEQRQAEAARQATAAERDKVLRKQRALERGLADLESMADLYRVAQLRRELDALGPQSWKIGAMRSWLAPARELRERLKDHQQILQRLERKQQLSNTERWQRELVAGLIPQIEPLVGAIGTVDGWLRDKPWREWRQSRTDRWRRAIDAIRKHPKYGGLVLTPQEGLAPLGADRETGLWEFVHLPSGSPPVRDAAGKWPVTGRTGIVLVLIPGGTFWMGATVVAGAAGMNMDPHARAEDGPVQRVRLAPFFMGKYELTQGQWLRMTGSNPSKYRPGREFGSERVLFSLTHPVESVSWRDGNRWLQRWGLRLPTEAQWEYAARAGTRSVWWSGNAKAGLALAGNLADQALFQSTGLRPFEAWHDGHVIHAPVGRFAANGFGLHDVIGNVYEWCRDPFLSAEDRPERSGSDGWREHFPAALGDQVPRLYRGGAWSDPAFKGRSARRIWGDPDRRSNARGLRSMRDIRP